MKRFSTYLIILSLQFWSIGTTAQTDTLIVGGSSGFNSLESAVNSLHNQTLTDTLRVLVSPGAYEGDYEMSDLEGLPVVFEGIYENPDSVRLIQTGIYFDLHDVENVIFKNIHFQAASNYVVSIVQFTYGGNATFINCKFTPSENFNGNAISFRYSDMLTIERCQILGGEVYSNTGEMTFRNNVFHGEVDLHGLNHCMDNTFFGLTKPSAGEHYNNTYYEEVRFNNGSVDFFKNTCFGDIRSSFDDDISIYKNVIFGKTDLNGGNNYLLSNNHFHDDVDVLYLNQPTLRVLSNNFGPEANLYCVASTVHFIANNNFSDRIHFQQGSPENLTGFVKNNNHWPGQGQLGLDRHHIAPHYYSNDSLLPSNPLLVGQSAIIWSFAMSEDILGIQRPINATIGANEYCVEADTLHITCGERVSSKLCLFSDEADLIVEPAAYAEESSYNFPMLVPPVSTTFYLFDETTGLSDSIYVLVDSMVISPASPLLGTTCGVPVKLLEVPQLNGQNGSFNIEWEPSVSVSEYPINQWYASITESTIFHYTLEHEWCGTFTDSVTVYVSNNPLAHGEALLIGNGLVSFTNLSLCENSVQWDFGDGSVSELENPSHEYSSSGTYFWTLTASNSIFSDTYTAFIDIPNVTGLTNGEKNSFKLYPNPTSGSLKIATLLLNRDCRVLIFASTGQKALEFTKLTTSPNGEIELNISELPQGLYTIRIFSDHHVNSGKFVKE